MLFALLELNLRIVRPSRASTTALSTTKKLPAPSKARSIGLPSRETNALFTPSGVNLKIESPFDTKRLPEPSKARPTASMPVANVLFLPSGVNL